MCGRHLLLLLWLCTVTTSTDISLVHPLLYFDASDVGTLRDKAATSHALIFNQMADLVQLVKAKPSSYLPPLDWNEFSGSWNEHYGNHLGALAMYCVLKPDDRDALNLTITYMDRMALLPNWKVKSNPSDDVPVSHSLVGFATAFDFLYTYLDNRRRTDYLDKLKRVAGRHYVRSKVASWGRQYIHNHVATNVVALFTASLVILPHDIRCRTWRDYAVILMERTLALLNLVVDGSLQEGVTYGSYTARSITQFVYLCLRHMKRDHTRDFFLKQHFRFYLATVLPGFQETVGIADSSRTWFYGPESQLVFLDAYVMRNGYGNWLASRIRENRVMSGALQPAKAHRWCTLHTEFIWYNAYLPEKSPFNSGGFGTLIKFSDWGIVTYGGGRNKGHTFVSFKSGPLHGRAIYMTIQKKLYEWIAGWWSFNPGHEHPDQNSFVFFPNGKPFITEAHYGPKYTFLNNVLTFGPIASAKCYAPHQGQNGECQKWLLFKDDNVEHTWADVVTATNQAGMLFVSGDATRAYPSNLKLESVYRTLLLLDNRTLLVLDHIALRDRSGLKVSNAYFHNIHASFQLTKPSDIGLSPRAYIEHEGQKHSVYWISSDQTELKATTNSLTYPAEFGTRKTNFLNVSVPLTQSVTRVAYLFAAQGSQITKLHFLTQGDVGVRITVGIDGTIYNASIVTDHKDATSRYKWLGFLGFAQVNVSTGLHVRFGLDTIRQTTSNKVSQHKAPVALKSAGILFEESFQFEQPMMPKVEFLTETVPKALESNFIKEEKYEFILLAFGVVLFILVLQIRKKTVVKYLLLVVVVSLLVTSGVMMLRPHTSMTEDHHETQNFHKGVLLESVDGLEQLQPDIDLLSFPRHVPKKTRSVTTGSQQAKVTTVFPPKVFVTSFLASGSELVADLFDNRTDFLVSSFPTSALEPPRLEFEVDPFVDACHWSSSLHSFPLIGGWFKSIYTDPLKHLDPPANIPVSGNVKKYLASLKSHRLANPNTHVILRSVSASWNLKLPWLLDVIGHSLKMIYIVRDPRGWIASVLNINDNRYVRWNVEQRLQDMFKELPNVCDVGMGYAPEYDLLQTYFTSGKMKPQPLKLLATLWQANTEAALRINKWLPKSNYLLIRFEDLIRFPVQTATKIFQFVGMPLPLSVEHVILQRTRTGLFRLGPEKLLGLATADTWKNLLTLNQIREIEAICVAAMKELSYKIYSFN